MFAQPPVHDVGVDTVFERDRCNGGANLAALANSLKFELWTVKPPLGDFGMSLARHDVHDLHRAHYRRGSARAQDVFTGRIPMKLLRKVRYEMTTAQQRPLPAGRVQFPSSDC